MGVRLATESAAALWSVPSVDGKGSLPARLTADVARHFYHDAFPLALN